MEKTADPKQLHIWYESCEEHGMFMDAGEFTDFQHESPLDFFRGLIKGDRGTTAPKTDEPSALFRYQHLLK